MRSPYIFEAGIGFTVLFTESFSLLYVFVAQDFVSVFRFIPVQASK